MVMQPTDYVKFCPICNETKQNTSLCFNNLQKGIFIYLNQKRIQKYALVVKREY